MAFPKRMYIDFRNACPGTNAAVQKRDFGIPRWQSIKGYITQHVCERGMMTAIGVRRGKAALSSGCESHPANSSSRKQPEQLWRKRNG